MKREPYPQYADTVPVEGYVDCLNYMAKFPPRTYYE